MMSYAFDRSLPGAMKWRELFDLVIVEARKPDVLLPAPGLVPHDGRGPGLLRPHRGLNGSRAASTSAGTRRWWNPASACPAPRSCTSATTLRRRARQQGNPALADRPDPPRNGIGGFGDGEGAGCRCPAAGAHEPQDRARRPPGPAAAGPAAGTASLRPETLGNPRGPRGIVEKRQRGKPGAGRPGGAAGKGRRRAGEPHLGPPDARQETTRASSHGRWSGTRTSTRRGCPISWRRRLSRTSARLAALCRTIRSSGRTFQSMIPRSLSLPIVSGALPS